jgi:hypothetical protein
MTACNDLWNYWEGSQFYHEPGYNSSYALFTVTLHHATGLVEYLVSSQYRFYFPLGYVYLKSTLISFGAVTTAPGGPTIGIPPDRTLVISTEGVVTYWPRIIEPETKTLPSWKSASFQANCIGPNTWTGQFDSVILGEQVQQLVPPFPTLAPVAPPNSDPTYVVITGRLWEKNVK